MPTGAMAIYYGSTIHGKLRELPVWWDYRKTVAQIARRFTNCYLSPCLAPRPATINSTTARIEKTNSGNQSFAMNVF